ncbi:hypothetical protein N9Q05_02340 [bacterium]|nr:hypothetical protein [bacterium]
MWKLVINKDSVIDMVVLRYSKWLFVMILLWTTAVNAVTQQQNYYRNFWSPLYRGERLDYCMQGAQSCGSCVANRYCRIMGYEKASAQTIDYNVGLTHYLLTHAQCKGWTCNGFKLIRCAAKLTHNPPKAYFYRSEEFAFPRYAHYRVDWCYENGRGCGQRSANSFCRRMGYMKAKQYKKQTHVMATRALGNQRLCFGDTCNAFSQITCYR